MNALFFLHPGTNSRRIFLDMIDGFERLGHRAVVLELEPSWRAAAQAPAQRPAILADFTRKTAAIIRAERIDLSVSMWANSLTSLVTGVKVGRPETVFDALHSPHLLFWLDAPHWAHGGATGPIRPVLTSPIFRGKWLFHLINNPETAREMREVFGFSNVLSAPYGINERVFRPVEGEKREYDIVFACGPGDPPPTALQRAQLESGEPDITALRAAAADQIAPRLDAIADSLGPEAAHRALLGRVLQMQLADRDRPMLDRLAALAQEDAALARAAAGLRSSPGAFIDATMLIRSIENFERAFTFGYLARHVSCAWFGGADLSPWAPRAVKLGEVAHEDQARMYARGRLGLNVMRWQDDRGLNLKPFEITASGAACLTTRRAGLQECFHDGREVASFGTPVEALAAARTLLSDPDRLGALAGAGRDRTRREHTWAARLPSVLESVGKSAGRWD